MEPACKVLWRGRCQAPRGQQRLPKALDRSHCGEPRSPGSEPRFLELAAAGIAPRASAGRDPSCPLLWVSDAKLGCGGWASSAHPGVTYFLRGALLRLFQGLCAWSIGLQLKQGATRLAQDGGPMISPSRDRSWRWKLTPTWQPFASEGRRSDHLQTLPVLASGCLPAFAFCSVTGFFPLRMQKIDSLAGHIAEASHVQMVCTSAFFTALV